MNYQLHGAVAFLTAVSAVQPAHAARFNDTGLTTCLLQRGVVTENCTGTGQDAEFGRDATANVPKNGAAGFKFAKLDENGETLPSRASTWACVRDDITGLTWELKTTTGIHAGEKKFTNTPQAGDEASAFAESVNTAAYCGFSDWRVPSKDEADTLVLFARAEIGGALGIDSNFFLDGIRKSWTSSCTSPAGSCATTSYTNGNLEYEYSYDFYPVRLVRGKPLVAAAKRYEVNDSEVYDRRTGIYWTRCAEGQSWTGNTCLGPANLFTWKEAQAFAERKSSATGVRWRLASVKELMSITVHPWKENAVVDAKAFPNNPQLSAWSSTASAKTFWAVDYLRGTQFAAINTITDRLVLRLVHD